MLKSSSIQYDAGVTGLNFPTVSFVPGERMGRQILSPRKFQATPFFTHPVISLSLIIFKIHNTYLLLFKKLESGHSFTDRTHTICCFVVI